MSKHAWLILVVLHCPGTLPGQWWWSRQDVPLNGGSGMPPISVEAFSVSPFGGRDLFPTNTAARDRCGPVAMAGSNSYNPMDDETPAEREERMKLVRAIQKSFYKDEESPTVPELAYEINDTDTDGSSACIQNLPLWRVQWTELPGSQNVLNVHVPHYTNMFQKILKGNVRAWGEPTDGTEDSGEGDYGSDDYEDDDWEMDNDDDTPAESLGPVELHPEPYYFGHIFLPGGSENLDNEEYALREGDVGTLMRVSDARQQDDGRLTLVVQALEKFRIERVERSHSPYAIADVTIVPDLEQLLEVHPDTSNTTILTDDDDDDDDDDHDNGIQTAWSEAVKWALGNHFFEYRTVSIDECEDSVFGLGVSPLSNYDTVWQPLVPTAELECRTRSNRYRDVIAVAESDTWIQLDELLNLLKVASNGVGVPVPTQILGLLPESRAVATTETEQVEKVPWPNNFLLAGVVERMKGYEVGTHSKSPFVHIDGDTNDSMGTTTMYYSPLRRAQRLSYVIWTLTESIALPPEPGTDGTDKFGHEAILRVESTQERLELATEKMSRVCLLLRNTLRYSS